MHVRLISTVYEGAHELAVMEVEWNMNVGTLEGSVSVNARACVTLLVQMRSCVLVERIVRWEQKLQ